MKISTYFRLEEFVPKEVFTQFGDNSIWFIDNKIIMFANFVRGRFGKPMTINNWHSGGILNYRGFRPRACDVGGELSQHRFGRAIDFNIEGSTPQEIYKDITTNFDMYSKAGLTTVEDILMTPSWNHCDIRSTNSSELLIVKPKE